jgi:hypothetical protein
MSMSDQRFQPFAHEQPSFSGVESQPYVNGNGQERRDEQPQQSQPPQQQPSVDEAEDAPIGAEPQPEADFRPEGGGVPIASVAIAPVRLRAAARSPKAPGPAARNSVAAMRRRQRYLATSGA